MRQGTRTVLLVALVLSGSGNGWGAGTGPERMF